MVGFVLRTEVCRGRVLPAVDYNVMLITNRQIAMRFIESIMRGAKNHLEIRSWQEYS